MFLFTLCACVVFFTKVYYALVSYFSLPHPPLFNKAGLLAWVHTCYFYLYVADRVGPPPHLSLLTPGWGCAPLIALSDTVQGVSLPPSLHCSLLGCVAATLIPLLLGCVAATLIALLSFGCVAATLIACALWGVLLPPLFYPRVHPTTFSPIYCKSLCILSCLHS